LVLERIAENTANAIDEMLAPTLNLAPIDKLRELELLGEPGFVANLCRDFLTDTPIRIQRMKDALESGDLVQLERDSHSLKASSASLGATNMSQLCATIEAAVRGKNLDGVATLLEQLTLEMPLVAAGFKQEGLA
jgi:HPt (histidine-containing phosphotransfer) domain-containing protein